MLKLHLPPLLNQTKKLIIALSGGADSIALSHLLLQKKQFTLILAHFNHHLRTQSKQEEKLVQAFARQNNLLLEVGHWEKPIQNEEKARLARYAFLNAVKKKHQAELIVLGHHQDDQAETILFNFIRGTGLTGLKGMQILNEKLWRPLLPFSKKEILEYCQMHQLAFCVDESNFDKKYTRNFLRHQIIPELIKINPNFSKILNQNSNYYAEIDRFLKELIQPFLKQNHLEIKTFLALDPVLQTELIKQKITPYTTLSNQKIQEIIALIQKQSTGKFKILGNLKIHLEYNVIIFEDLKVTKTNTINSNELLKLKLNTVSTINQFKITIKPASKIKKTVHSLFLDYAKIQFPVFIRFWQKGDRWIPSGMQGSQKLSDFFTNQKIPQTERKFLPLLVDANNQILAIGVLRSSQIACISPQSKNFLEIQIQK